MMPPDSFEFTDEMREKILCRRAAVLADRNSSLEESGARIEVLLAEAGGRLFAMSTAQVRQIVSFPRWAPVPDAHPALLGLINVQNELICLISPYPYLKEAQGREQSFSKAMALSHPVLRVAIGCDEVIGFAKLKPEQIKENRVFESDGRPGTLLDANELLEPFLSVAPVW